LRIVIWFLGIAFLTAPVGFLVTILLMPFWRWFEAFSGIEAVGHSGPAAWCYLLVFGVFLVGVGVMLRSFARAKREEKNAHGHIQRPDA
jgi:H+/Cl- antiporter ClcA